MPSPKKAQGQARKDLLRAYDQKYRSISNENASAEADHAKEIYYKYHHELNSISQVLFRDMVLASTTRILLYHLNKTTSDISSTYTSDNYFVVLYVIIEAHDKHGGGLSGEGSVETNKMCSAIQCCREFVHFIHERNSCNCLESAYNELKRAYRRTNVCGNCNEDKPAKQIKVCSGCNVALYCSRECQLAHYPVHIEECTWMQDAMSTAECVQ
jgi:hypothetical protein